MSECHLFHSPSPSVYLEGILKIKLSAVTYDRLQYCLNVSEMGTFRSFQDMETQQVSEAESVREQLQDLQEQIAAHKMAKQEAEAELERQKQVRNS